MAHRITIEVEEVDEGYRARVQGSPASHQAVSEDPLHSICGAIAVSRGYIDETVGFDRDGH